ncbi:MAG: hypothetical protein HOD60_04575, partial [Candidatus Nitrosopelagicus sp.]|nr:hypothetical protein [Candidatus Nitrosopelagicus sp.]
MFSITAFAIIGMMIPNVDAYWLNGVEYNSINEIVSTPSGNSENKIVDPNASGKIIQKQNNFKLYGGNLIPVTIFVEMNNFIHNPTLTIFHNEILIKTIYPRSGGNLFQSTIGLDDNWKSGIYQINLNHQNKVLDISSFVITRDNESFEEKIFHESMFKSIEPYISVNPSKVILDSHSFEKISVTGSVNSQNSGHNVDVKIITPDDRIISHSILTTSDGIFSYEIITDKNWISGEYIITAKHVHDELLSDTFVVKNNWQEIQSHETNVVGSFDISSEISRDYTILSISGNIETDQKEITLNISKDGDILYEDSLILTEKFFETSTVLYDYEQNIPWEYGEYQITGIVGEESFHSEKFILDGQAISPLNFENVHLFLNMGTGLESMVDFSEIEINSGDETQVILSGTMDGYVEAYVLDVHLIHPDGTDEKSHLYASSNGFYYLPIIIDDTWVSGTYTAYVQFREFMDDASTFTVINNSIKDDSVDLELIESEIILEDLKNYVIILDNSQSVDSVHYFTTMQSYSGKTPITISLNDELLKEEFTYSSDDGLIDFRLLLNPNWNSGNYTVSYIENNVSVPFGTFEIFNNYVVEDTVEDVVEVELIEQNLTLGSSLFKSSSHVVEYLEFFGKLVDDSTNKVSISLDGELQTIVPLDSDGNYAGTISLGDNLDSGFHTLSMSSGNIAESAEFLITTNHYITLEGDLQIFRNQIIESGGEISVFLSKLVPNFVPSEVQPVIITVEGDDSYQRFSVMPKGYGFYSQNFMIDGTPGSYDVSVTYGGKLIESYNVNVLSPAPEWIKSHTTSWLN